MKTVGDLRNEITAILTGIDLDEVPDLYGSLERAVSTTIQKADILEAGGRDPIMLYDRVTDYLAPPTIFGGALIDIRPQSVDNDRWADVEKMPITRFNQTRFCVPSGYNVTFEDRKGVLIMRIAQNYTRKAITINSMSETTDWDVAGDATAPIKDSTVYYHQPASLRFNLTP